MIINAYSTLREPHKLDFPHHLLGQRGRSMPALIEHLNGFMGFVCDDGKREMTATLYAVMQHIQRTRQHFSFEVADDALNSSTAWGWCSNSIYFLTDNTVRDPAGAVLVDPASGQPESTAVVPYPSDAIARRQRMRDKLTTLGINISNDLPPTLGQAEVMMRPDDEAGWRMLSLFIVAVRAESLATGNLIPVPQLRAKSPMAFEAMSPDELAFVADETPDHQSIVNFAWRYEALYLLQWALGLHDELKFADTICDVPLVAETMVNQADRQIVNAAKLRPATEILEAVEENQQMLWAARQARIENREPPAGLDGGVLSERQHALNWLIQFGDAPWDEVDTPT